MTDIVNINPDDDTIIDEDETTYNFTELYAAILEHKDLILTIPSDQVDALKQGLSVKKSKEYAKFKSAGLAVPTDAFSYLVYKDKETEGTGNTKVRIKLGPRTNISVLKLEIPDDRI